jgi:hypothetical protein
VEGINLDGIEEELKDLIAQRDLHIHFYGGAIEDSAITFRLGAGFFVRILTLLDMVPNRFSGDDISNAFRIVLHDAGPENGRIMDQEYQIYEIAMEPYIAILLESVVNRRLM